MKVLEVHCPFKSSGVKQKLDYEVVSNAKMMKQLSDSLYEDKIKAVIRELSTNAWDSHVMAGNTNRPFVVFLPTSNNLVFRIRDYGTGMSPDQVMDMYRKYGASDKLDSNLTQGCMGIGSKSPFAYTDQFTSISYWNGTRYTWINAKNDLGVPTINFMGSCPTEEPNGFEVSLAVKSSDCSQFQSKVATVCRPFPLVPIFENNNVRVSIISESDFFIRGQDWGIIADNSSLNTSYGAKNSYVSMGCVEYPIEASHFADNPEPNGKRVPGWYNTNGTNDYVNLLNLGIYLWCDIGEVEMSMSREALQYHPSTIKAIKLRLDEILSELKSRILTNFEQCKTLWEVRVLYNELTTGKLRNLKRLYDTIKLEWRGKDITTYSTSLSSDYNIVFFKSSGKRRDKVSNVSATKNVRFFINDVYKGAYATCLRELRGTINSFIYLMKFDDDAQKQKFMDEIGIVRTDFIYVSSLPKPERRKSVRQNIGKDLHVYKGEGYSYYSRKTLQYPSSWQKADGVVDTGLYVELNHWCACDQSHHKMNLKHFDTILSLCKQINISINNVHGVKSSQLKKFQNNSKWTNLFDFIQSETKKLIERDGVSEAINNLQEASTLNYSNLWVLLNPDEFKNDVLVQLISRYQQQQGINKTTITIIKEICDKCGFGDLIRPMVNSITLQDLEKNVVKTYPMLKHIEFYGLSNGAVSDIVKYIKQVDSI